MSGSKPFRPSGDASQPGSQRTRHGSTVHFTLTPSLSLRGRGRTDGRRSPYPATVFVKRLQTRAAAPIAEDWSWTMAKSNPFISGSALESTATIRSTVF